MFSLEVQCLNVPESLNVQYFWHYTRMQAKQRACSRTRNRGHHFAAERLCHEIIGTTFIKPSGGYAELNLRAWSAHWDKRGGGACNTFIARARSDPSIVHVPQVKSYLSSFISLQVHTMGKKSPPVFHTFLKRYNHWRLCYSVRQML